MTTRAILVAAVAVAVLATGSGVATGSADVAVKKQRIAIEGTFNSGAGAGKFKLIPLTPGPLKRDSGRFKTLFTGAHPATRRCSSETGRPSRSSPAGRIR